MASLPSTSSPGPLCRIDPDTVKCPICLEIFERPVQMGCGHVVCKQCHEQLAEASSSDDRSRRALTIRRVIQCPECRVTSNIPSGGAPECFVLKSVIEQFKKQVDLTGDTVIADDQSFVTCTLCRENLKMEKAFVCLSCLKGALNTGHHVICGSCGIDHHENHKVVRISLASEEDRLQAQAQLETIKSQCVQEFYNHRDQVRTVRDQLDSLTEGLEQEVQNFNSYEHYLRGPILRNRMNGIQKQYTDRHFTCQEAFKKVSAILKNISEGLDGNSLELSESFRELANREGKEILETRPDDDASNYTSRGRIADNASALDVDPHYRTVARQQKRARRRLQRTNNSTRLSSSPSVQEVPTPLVIHPSAASNVETEEEEL